MSEIFSRRLRDARGNRSQAEVCAAIGVKQGTYSTWELGKYEPSFEVLVKLATYLGTSTDKLLGMPDTAIGVSDKTTEKLECAKRAFFLLNDAVKELKGAL